MGLALLFIALPFGIAIGFILGLLNRKRRRIAIALQAILFLICILLISTDASFVFILILLGIPPSIVTMFLIGKIKEPSKRLITGIKKSKILKTNKRKIIITIFLFLGLYIGKSIIHKHNINKQLVGKWYAKQEGNRSPYYKNVTYYEFDEHGNGTKLHLPYDTPESILTNSIERLSDNEMKLVFRTPFFFNDGEVIITKLDSITDNFYSGSIIQESEYFNIKADKISEGELMSFWEQNILPIINYDEDIMLQRSNPHLVSNNVFTGVYENEKDDYVLKNTFSDELRTGLQKFNYKDINQIEMDNGDVLLAIYFIGKNYFNPYLESRVECYSHFGLFFAKNGNDWNLISLQEVADCQKYDYQNDQPKKYENPKIVDTRLGMIVRTIEFYQKIKS